jgi:hypothetical protein
MTRAETKGFEYWVSSTVPFDLLVLSLSNGAAPSYRLVLDNKSEAAQFYTQRRKYLITIQVILTDL